MKVDETCSDVPVQRNRFDAFLRNISFKDLRAGSATIAGKKESATAKAHVALNQDLTLLRAAGQRYAVRLQELREQAHTQTAQAAIVREANPPAAGDSKVRKLGDALLKVIEQEVRQSRESPRSEQMQLQGELSPSAADLSLGAAARPQIDRMLALVRRVTLHARASGPGLSLELSNGISADIRLQDGRAVCIALRGAHGFDARSTERLAKAIASLGLRLAGLTLG